MNISNRTKLRIALSCIVLLLAFLYLRYNESNMNEYLHSFSSVKTINVDDKEAQFMLLEKTTNDINEDIYFFDNYLAIKGKKDYKEVTIDFHPINAYYTSEKSIHEDLKLVSYDDKTDFSIYATDSKAINEWLDFQYAIVRYVQGVYKKLVLRLVTMTIVGLFLVNYMITFKGVKENDCLDNQDSEQ